MKSKLFIVVLLLGLLTANISFAAIVNCGGRGQPECSVPLLIQTIRDIINLLLSWAWMICVVVIVWAGITMLTSGGNEEAVSKGKTILKNGLIGFVLILLSYIVLNLAVALLTGGSPGADLLGGFRLRN